MNLNLEKLKYESMIRRLRNALYYESNMRTGWNTSKTADTFEESKELVPLNDEEQEEYK